MTDEIAIFTSARKLFPVEFLLARKTTISPGSSLTWLIHACETAHTVPLDKGNRGLSIRFKAS